MKTNRFATISKTTLAAAAMLAEASAVLSSANAPDLTAAITGQHKEKKT